MMCSRKTRSLVAALARDDSFAAGINFVESAFARSEIKVNLYLACLIAALSNPADFVVALARNGLCAIL